MSERLEERLRRAAQTYRNLGNHTAEGMFLEAADTLTELRGALQVASVDYRHLSEENAKLREDLEFERSENGWAREFLNLMGQKCGTKDCPSLVAYVNRMEAENAKLRELCADLYAEMITYSKAPNYNASVWAPKLRELGVEVG